MNLDKFDIQILSILNRDARTSLQDISVQIGLSTTPCWTRIKRMESAGVILGYTIRIDPATIGFSETVMVQITLESHSDETLYEFGKALEKPPEVLDAYLISGDYGATRAQEEKMTTLFQPRRLALRNEPQQTINST